MLKLDRLVFIDCYENGLTAIGNIFSFLEPNLTCFNASLSVNLV